MEPVPRLTPLVIIVYYPLATYHLAKGRVMMCPAQYFRAGVGAVIVNSKGLVLAMERVDIPGAWQLPQGGIERSEEPLRAAFREVAEETGIPESDLELVDAY